MLSGPGRVGLADEGSSGGRMMNGPAAVSCEGDIPAGGSVGRVAQQVMRRGSGGRPHLLASVQSLGENFLCPTGCPLTSTNELWHMYTQHK